MNAAISGTVPLQWDQQLFHTVVHLDAKLIRTAIALHMPCWNVGGSARGCRQRWRTRSRPHVGNQSFSLVSMLSVRVQMRVPLEQYVFSCTLQPSSSHLTTASSCNQTQSALNPPKLLPPHFSHKWIDKLRSSKIILRQREMWTCNHWRRNPQVDHLGGHDVVWKRSKWNKRWHISSTGYGIDSAWMEGGLRYLGKPRKNCCPERHASCPRSPRALVDAPCELRNIPPSLPATQRSPHLRQISIWTFSRFKI